MIMANKRSFYGDLSLLSAVNLFQLIGLASLSGQLKNALCRKFDHLHLHRGETQLCLVPREAIKK